VLLDMDLATGTGFDVLRALHSRLPQVDFYMLSNFTASPYRQAAGRLGARGYFDKSKDFERVRDLIAGRAAANTTH
jgi:DNA-binding NarL/FixJ family response regulator